MTVDSYLFCPKDPSEYIARFTTESAAMSSLIETQPLDAAVPTCGDWDLAALATQLGGCTDGPPLRCERPQCLNEVQ